MKVDSREHKKKERENDREIDLIHQTGWHTERNFRRIEKFETIRDLKQRTGGERCIIKIA